MRDVEAMNGAGLGIAPESYDPVFTENPTTTTIKKGSLSLAFYIYIHTFYCILYIEYKICANQGVLV